MSWEYVQSLVKHLKALGLDNKVFVVKHDSETFSEKIEVKRVWDLLMVGM